MSKDCPRLSRLGVLAPAALSVCMDASVLAVPAAGAIVSTVLKELSKAFMLKKWFHGIMSAKEAEHLMMEKGKNGSFLVRESLTHPGEYVLSVRVRGRVSHVMIRRQRDKYDVGSGEHFDDLVGLIEHFRSYPMIENSGDVLRLLQPVSGTCLRVKDIQRKVQEMEVSQLAPNWTAYDEEFHSLRMLDTLNIYSHKEGIKPENIRKNRYKNVLPFDQTRVILHDHSTDYINANFIRPIQDEPKSSGREPHAAKSKSKSSSHRKDKKHHGSSLVAKSVSIEAMNEFKKMIKLDGVNGNYYRYIIKDKVYIATQGPLPNTVDDFWRMLWQEDVRVIAMITKEKETERANQTKIKCECYWPEFGKERTYCNLNVKFQFESGYDEYVVREFEVNDNTTSRVIYQYHYTAWEDHEIPANPSGVIRYLNDINRKMYHIQQEKDFPEQNILCVHCSAGVGRTGTFIAIDTLIDKIKISGFNCDIDVHNTVKTIRSQRHGMVQNKAQYRFIYHALKNYIEGNNTKVRKMVYKLQA